jgi:Family of unknown function (DUF6074)
VRDKIMEWKINSASLTASEALIVPFPLHRRFGKIRAVAKMLALRRSEAGQQNCWARVIGGLEAELRRHGSDERAVELQLLNFRQAVTEMLSQATERPIP